MTVGVDDELRVREYPGDDSANARAVPFYFLDSDDLKVTRINADGSETVLVRGTHYSVAGAGNPSGGSVTPLASIATGTSWRIEGDMALGQPTDYTAGDDFPAESHERALDRSMIGLQETRRDLQDTVARAVMVPRGEAPPTLPAAPVRQGKYFAFDAGGAPVMASGTGADSALRTDLAEDTGLQLLGGAPGFATAREELDSKGPVSTKSLAAGATLYPVDFRLGRDIPPHPFEYVPANQHAAIIAGTTTYDASADLQAMCDGWNPDFGQAGMIDFPEGVFGLGGKILFPNWVSWRGQGRGTQFAALDGHVGPYMFQFDSDPDKVEPTPVSRFNQRLENFDINAMMHLAGREALTKIIYAPSWNEKCGLRDVMARNVGCTFLDIDEWHGGSAGFQITDLEVFFTPAAYTAAVQGLRFRGRTRAGGLIVNRPQVTLRNVTMAGGTAGVDDANPGLAMIVVDNMHVQLLGGIHFEKAKIGIDVQNNAMLTGFGLTGSDVNGCVVTMVNRQGSHTGRIDLRDVYKGSGGIRDFNDSLTGLDRVTSPGGVISVPSLPGEAWAAGRFKIVAGAVSESQLMGCSAVIRDGATGFFRVTHADAMPSGDAYSVVAEAHDETACYAVSRPSERVGGTFHIRVYRHSDNTLFDPAEVTFRVYRKPGL